MHMATTLAISNSVLTLAKLMISLIIMTGFCGFSGCGDYGKCSFNDTCICEKGYFGHLCNETRKLNYNIRKGSMVTNGKFLYASF